MPSQEAMSANLPGAFPAADGGELTLADVPWSWAFSLSSPHGPSGYLVVGAKVPPADGERFVLQVLAQQATVALAAATDDSCRVQLRPHSVNILRLETADAER